MTTSKRHRVLIASDGSPSARMALETAVKFPWPGDTHVHVVIANSEWLRPDSDEARSAVTRANDAVANAARRTLAPRWPKPGLAILETPPVDAILAEAQRLNASVLVLGWRGHGTFRRLLAGSVSRAVAARAKRPVLVVREAPRAVRRFVVAFDGSENAKHAVRFLCSLEPLRGNRAVLVNVVEPVSVPASVSLLPASTRAHIQREVRALNEQKSRRAQKALEAALARLRGCGWTAKAEVRVGAPLERLLRAAQDHRADVFVLGARAVSGVERALLGSVANGALNRSRVPVLLVS